MATTHEFTVAMTCEGCSGAVTRILTKKLEEGSKFNVDLGSKKVTITSDKPKEELVAMLEKSGKSVDYIGSQ